MRIKKDKILDSAQFSVNNRISKFVTLSMLNCFALKSDCVTSVAESNTISSHDNNGLHKVQPILNVCYY